MAIQHLLVIVFVASILHAASSATTKSTLAAATAYDVLEQNNLPRGLLPQGVQSYSLRGGDLAMTLLNVCEFSVAVAGKQYRFRYDKTVGGTIQSGSISKAYGVRVQVEFAWLGFNQVQRVGDQLTLHLETSTLSFPVSAFTQSPRCN
ncbi:uncharacterized protein LOC104583917 [Brachypodium distachyon]|uniref:Uncharacterized protein n=1 Tax=Brachypodium distachyon TaxID=15368 RepID=I1HWJ9_BRADI|nr:uncharacterized protein LOC104583917 [Brachypodium distachyon]KQJ92981.1 hypothetical protein BRADI_3g02020v3 [Brachypodium distachyon]|eukprot:XP_010236236.1 uncharacterized protein LOC104583917 [Brachypodium distachyon]